MIANISNIESIVLKDGTKIPIVPTEINFEVTYSWPLWLQCYASEHRTFPDKFSHITLKFWGPTSSVMTLLDHVQ